MTLIEYLRALKPSERKTVAELCRCSAAYVQSLIYKNNKGVGMHLAVAADKHSGGKMDFRQLVSRGNNVDWAYVKQALNERPEIKES